jgi:hypothetical protein
LAAIGQRHTNDRYLRDVLLAAWSLPFSTKSDFARLAADEIAEAACRGLITTRTEAGAWGRYWRITPAGAAIICPEIPFPMEEEQVG